ncbi:Translocation protein Sec62 [Popillia japonica]|uniref:Translocation protein SEC62 n=1 Tax=Popillia japonica TaxID=7064 RepID=A0AAW1M027_POPJA
MAEKKKGKRRKDDYVAPGEELAKPTKDEYNVGKWLRKNVPIKKTKFLNHNVEYFTGSRAVDSLLESQFAQGNDAIFKSRTDVIHFLHTMLEHKFFHRARKVPMLEHKFFHRARKVPVSEQELKSKRKDKKPSEDEKKKDDKKDKKEKEKGTDAESSVVEGKSEVANEKEKRKRKVRLEMHPDQQFVDSLDAYVSNWNDPIPFYYWIFGAFLVLGAIGICLFPLWPPSVRLGVYYLSVAAAGFLVFIIFLVVLRLIIFCAVWMFTLGRHHIWILPNLTEDVGFFASFWPLYQYEYKGPDTVGEDDSKKDKKKRKKLKEKDSDAEDSKNGDKTDGVSESETTVRHRNVSKQNVEDDRQNDGSGSSGGKTTAAAVRASLLLL